MFLKYAEIGAYSFPSIKRRNSMSDEPVVAQTSPYAVNVEAGQRYYWCSCGRSKEQPFCDGSHQGTGLEPVEFTADKSEEVYLCGCKQTSGKPFCDGRHNKL
jgi:CDGSH-type Zn-finger protein